MPGLGCDSLGALLRGRCLVAVAGLALAAPAAPHGAQYGAPGDGGYGPGMAGVGAAAGGGMPFATGASGAVAGDYWEIWWFNNQDRFLRLRSRLATDAPASAQGVLTGRGRVERGGTRRAAADQVEREVLPLLLELLSEADEEPEVVDSALIALGRCADESDADRVLEAVRPRLSSTRISVQSSAVLALGIHGSPRFVPLLGALMADAAAGRTAIGGNVPPLLRSLAALSLGLGNHDVAVSLLLDELDGLPDTQASLKACIITGLGTTGNDAGDEALSALFSLLKQRRMPATIAGQVPLAIARLDGGTRVEAVPPLLDAFLDRGVDDRVRISVAMALGRLASFNNTAAMDALHEAARSEKHVGTRHAVLMALAEIGLRDAPDAAQHAEQHKRLLTELKKQLADPPSYTDHGWCALAAGVYAHAGGDAAKLVGPLLDEHAARKEPSMRGASVVGLGLARAAGASGLLLEDFRNPGDALLRAHAGLALGFVGSKDALPERLAVCSDKSSDALLREQAALGLALLGEASVVPALVEVLGRTQSQPVSFAAARALGRIGDRSAIPALAALARDRSKPAATRGMAVVAVGLLGERGELPWNATLRELNNGQLPVDALQLVLDIL